jgi:hypothetical protein
MTAEGISSGTSYTLVIDDNTYSVTATNSIGNSMGGGPGGGRW